MMTTDPPLHIILHRPQIPPNTGNIIRLCANTTCQLHLIEPLGFSLEEKSLRRAGLDYHEWASVKVHADFDQCLSTFSQIPKIYSLTTRGTTPYHTIAFTPGTALLFGSETSGLPETMHAHPAITKGIRIPMAASSRSLNLSNSAAIVVYEALRQMHFVGLEH